MKMKYFYLAVFASLACFFIFSAFAEESSAEKKSDNEKVIKFSHSVHAELTDCASCHAKAAETEKLTADLLPKMADCASCHDVEDTEQCNTCHYEDVLEPFTAPKSELLFNHKQHIADQKLNCTDCHRGIESVDYAYKSPNANPPMAQCNTCHNDAATTSKASNACESCHISTANLKPQDHQTANFFRDHKFLAEDTKANCAMCHNDDFCESCHLASNVAVVNSPSDFTTPYAPHTYIDNAKQQKITRVHDLNYRFSHGIDAHDKKLDCQTCHQVETFCNECHEAEGGDYALAGVTPASHRKPNFIIAGIGTGGGEHATLAKRDIESCAACHDTEGGDPACITCHFDTDGIKGTNPKTHPTNFMSGEKGDWHDTQGSVCYTCHTGSPNGSRGVGFCGYCHN
jgi:hypothetical protein